MMRNACLGAPVNKSGLQRRVSPKQHAFSYINTHGYRNRQHHILNATRRTTGVVVVDHGSKRALANDMLDGVVDLYKTLIEEDMMEEGLTERDIVAVQKAHMEIARPSILDAVRVCVQEYGAQDIVVAPYFLSKGRHIQEDIPYLVKEAEAIVREESGLDVVCVVAEPLGVDRDVVEVVKRRVDSCLDNKRDYQKLL
ncbi:hypothetical protein M9435_002076 [Picochlorum sp. BPE23]|nr:hypothetical protein M9435_002076 [Picochlorum sp. BPE23]